MIEFAQYKILVRTAVTVAVIFISAALASAEPVISEFMAANSSIPDEDGAFSDWVEIFNPDPAPVNLDGWYLTDSAGSKTKWKFPAVTLQPNGYLVVWASNKNRRDPALPLHTNFALSAGGEYLGLVKPDGTTVVSEYGPSFPAQSDNISYGLGSGPGGSTAVGYLRRPTPGAANAALTLLESVTLSREAGPFTGSFQLILSGAEGAEHIRYLLVAPSAAGAVLPEPDATWLSYTGPITVDSSVIVCAAVFSDDDITHGLPATAHYLQIDPSLATFTSQLPVLVLDNHGLGAQVQDFIDHPAWLYTYNAANGAPTFGNIPQQATPLTESVRGSSSADFPKKGYNLKLNDALGNKRAQTLLDWSKPYEKWALVNPWCYDRSYIHNSFLYTLSNRLGRWAPRAQLTEVFFHSDAGPLTNASYAGIYALTDRVEVIDGRVNLKSLDSSDNNAPNLTGGYMFKIDIKDDDEENWYTSRNTPGGNGYSSLVLAYPKAEDITPTQFTYLKDYVQHMEDALYADRATGWSQRTYLDYIDRASWVDYHLLNTFSSNLDALERSTYFTKERGGKLVAGPIWDFDRAFNSGDRRGGRTDVWSQEESTDFWRSNWFGVIAQDPEFMQDWVDRWQSLRRGQLADANLTTLADTLGNSVGQDAAARDAARWSDNASRYPGGYAGEVQAFKIWLTDRAQWIDRQFAATPTVTDNGGSITFTPPAGAQLIYTLDGSDPRSLGGAIAPNAQTTSNPLTVPADANVHVRSYRADMKNSFPGSPWSSSVSGGHSSPLRPAARLINLSSRALIGSGQNALIAGVVVADTESKPYLARAIGPTLAAFGASNTLPDPILSLHREDGVEIFRNSSWQSGPDAAALPEVSKSVGAFALAENSHDAAMISSLGRGAYTLQIQSESGLGGIGLAELYTLDGNGRTLNLSTRAQVHTGDGVLIGGFVVQGPAYKRMLVRAVGPSLAQFGVQDVLLDPVLKIYSGQTLVATVDDWSAEKNANVIATASTAVGAFPLVAGTKDAALFITLPPGAYTVEISGKNNTEGVALLEIYDVP
jgi:hypothetical protein